MTPSMGQGRTGISFKTADQLEAAGITWLEVIYPCLRPGVLDARLPTYVVVPASFENWWTSLLFFRVFSPPVLLVLLTRVSKAGRIICWSRVCIVPKHPRT